MPVYTDEKGIRCFWVPEKEDDNKKTFDAAKQRCRNAHAHLAILNSAEKVAHIEDNGVLDGTDNRRWRI